MTYILCRYCVFCVVFCSLFSLTLSLSLPFGLVWWCALLCRYCCFYYGWLGEWRECVCVKFNHSRSRAFPSFCVNTIFLVQFTCLRSLSFSGSNNCRIFCTCATINLFLLKPSASIQRCGGGGGTLFPFSLLL